MDIRRGRVADRGTGGFEVSWLMRADVVLRAPRQHALNEHATGLERLAGDLDAGADPVAPWGGRHGHGDATVLTWTKPADASA